MQVVTETLDFERHKSVTKQQIWETPKYNDYHTIELSFFPKCVSLKLIFIHFLDRGFSLGNRKQQLSHRVKCKTLNKGIEFLSYIHNADVSYLSAKFVQEKQLT